MAINRGISSSKIVRAEPGVSHDGGKLLSPASNELVERYVVHHPQVSAAIARARMPGNVRVRCSAGFCAVYARRTDGCQRTIIRPHEARPICQIGRISVRAAKSSLVLHGTGVRNLFINWRGAVTIERRWTYIASISGSDDGFVAIYSSSVNCFNCILTRLVVECQV